MEAGNVKPRTPIQTITKGTTSRKKEPAGDQTKSIFGNTLDGFYLSKPAASYISKKAGLDELSNNFLTKTLQAFKFSKILDPIGGAYLRNAYSAVSFHGYGAGPVVSNPGYVVRFSDDIARMEKGLEPLDKRVETLVQAGSELASEKYEFMGMHRALSDLMISIFRKNKDIPERINRIDSTTSKTELESLANALSLNGFDDEINNFLQTIKAETDRLSLRQNQIDDPGALSQIMIEGAKKVDKGFEISLDKYSIFDRKMSGGYALQLMDKFDLRADTALRIADEVFVDYMDMSALLNIFRYQAAFGLVGMPFVGYTANATQLSARMLTEATGRSWLASTLLRANDTAIEGMLDLGMSMEQYLSFFQKPGLRILPFEETTLTSPGDFRGRSVPGESFKAGPVSYDTSPLNPMAIVDPSTAGRKIKPYDPDAEFTLLDFVDAALSTTGGAFDKLYRSFKDNSELGMREQTARDLQKIMEQIDEDASISEYEKEKVKKLVGMDPLSRVKEKAQDSITLAFNSVLDFITPSVGPSTKYVLDSDKTLMERVTKVAGIKTTPLSLRTILSSAVLDSETRQAMKSKLEAIKKVHAAAEAAGKESDIYKKIDEDLKKAILESAELRDQIDNLSSGVKITLKKAAIRELDMIRTSLISKYLIGNIDKKELQSLLQELE
jgi:hypothetical protein